MKIDKPNGTELMDQANAFETNCKTYTIENNRGTRMLVTNVGAAVISIFVKDKKGELADIVLGYSDPGFYLDDAFYIGSVVGRYANRIADGKIMIDNKTYQLSTNPKGFHHHGGVSGFNKKIFKAIPFKQHNENGILFRYTSPHLEEGYPGELELSIVYTLTEADEWKIEYRATTNATTIINLTQHSYFNLSGNLTAAVDAHEVQINSKYYLPVNPLQLSLGILEPVIDTPFDFTRLKKIGQDIGLPHEQLIISRGYDHSFVLDATSRDALKYAAIVKEKQSGRRMDVFTTEPSLHFYTGNFLEGVEGKEGKTYNQRSGFCLETQHFPDSPNHPHFPSTILKPGEEFYSQTIFKFSVEED